MNAFLNKLKKALFVFLVLSFVLSPVYARTVDEINKDILNNKKELEDLKKKLDATNKSLLANQSRLTQSGSEINKVKAQIEDLKLTSEKNNIEIKQLEKQIELKNLEKEEKEKELNSKLIVNYVNWKSSSNTSTILTGSSDIVKNLFYYEFVTNVSKRGLSKLSLEVSSLNQQAEQLREIINKNETEMKNLQAKQAFWEKQIQLYNDSIAKSKLAVNQMQSQSYQLTEMQANYNLEMEIAVAKTIDKDKTVNPGEMYFIGTYNTPRNGIECTGSFKYSGFNPGTDAFGHGIGMSQWGAHGMAAKGKSANEILTFYYQGTQIQTRPTKNIRIGSQVMNMETYVGGLGEVPDKACGTIAQIEAWNAYANQNGWAADDPRRDKYIIANNNMLSCWPEEAIKAQVIAARSYAYNKETICTTDSCQVWKGGSGKAWAAYETKDKVIIGGGDVVNAYYSGYNNNGRGTANIESVWPRSAPKSYFVSVNDNSFTTRPRLCNQRIATHSWNTNSYTIEQMQSMLNWLQERSNWTHSNYGGGTVPHQWNADNVRYLINNKIGSLRSMYVETDASGRAKKVKFSGTKGNGEVPGVFFRMMFNTWVQRTGNANDALMSITYTLVTAQ